MTTIMNDQLQLKFFFFSLIVFAYSSKLGVTAFQIRATSSSSVVAIGPHHHATCLLMSQSPPLDEKDNK